MTSRHRTSRHRRPEDDLPGLFDLAGAAPGNTTPSRPGVAVITDPDLEPDDRARELFATHVVPSSGCQFWVGAISSPDGYGRFNIRRGSRQRSISAHRFALLLQYPDLAERDAVGEHVCNEPLCVRVDGAHVRLGTQSANLAYAVGLGRHRGPNPTTTIDRVQRSILIRTYLLNGGDPERKHTLFRPVSSGLQLGLF